MATTNEPRLSKSERTREAVLEAAEDLFSETGFDATPLSAIGERAGIQGSAILYHYATKRELYEAVLDRMFSPMTRDIHRELKGEGSLSDRLAAITSTMVRFAAERPAAARLILREAFASAEAGDIVGNASGQQWDRIAQALAKEGEADFDPLMVWNIVVGAICFYFGAGPVVGAFSYDPADPAQVAAFEARMISVTQLLCGFDGDGASPT